VLLGITAVEKHSRLPVLSNARNAQLLSLHITRPLAAQLYQEFRTLFPENAVEYFVSYYDYYQPEAYVPAADVYIEKEAIVNQEIDSTAYVGDSRTLRATGRDCCGQRIVHLRPRRSGCVLRFVVFCRTGHAYVSRRVAAKVG
jgi:hypothetical protein